MQWILAERIYRYIDICIFSIYIYIILWSYHLSHDHSWEYASHKPYVFFLTLYLVFFIIFILFLRMRLRFSWNVFYFTSLTFSKILSKNLRSKSHSYSFFLFLFFYRHSFSTIEYWNPILYFQGNLTHPLDKNQNIHFYVYSLLEVSCNSNNTKYKYNLLRTSWLSLHFTETRKRTSSFWQVIQQLAKTMIDK